ncbi:MAG: ABC transporter substrate-binding protein [Haloarculaceae archaeon]
MRVVSLLPSATEICYELGVEPVGVSHECDYPPAAADVQSLNSVEIDPDGSPADVDAAVDEAAEDGVYTIDDEAFAAADPDLVLTQATCDVCAIDRGVVEAALERTGVEADVIALDVGSLADLYAAIERIGAALDREERAAAVVEDLRTRVDAVADRAAGAEATPRVAVLDWLDPVMVAGHWVPEMAELIGAEYGLADPGDRSTPREWDAVCAYDPEVLVLAPCGFELPQTRTHHDAVTDRPGYADLAAVRTDRVYAMDGHHYVNRGGPRLVDTLEYLAALGHPDRFDAPPEEAVVSLDGVADSGAGTATGESGP